MEHYALFLVVQLWLRVYLPSVCTGDMLIVCCNTIEIGLIEFPGNNEQGLSLIRFKAIGDHTAVPSTLDGLQTAIRIAKANFRSRQDGRHFTVRYSSSREQEAFCCPVRSQKILKTMLKERGWCMKMTEMICLFLQIHSTELISPKKPIAVAAIINSMPLFQQSLKPNVAMAESWKLDMYLSYTSLLSLILLQRDQRALLPR